MKNKHVGVIVVALVLIAGGLYWVLKPSAEVVAPIQEELPASDQGQNFVDNSPTNSATNTLPPTKNSILVSSQIVGNYVTIDNIFLEQPSYVVVQMVDSTGKAGEVVGVSGLLTAGNKQDFEIKLKSPLKPNSSYVATMYSDNGDKTFNQTTDKQLTDNKDSAISAKFNTAN